MERADGRVGNPSQRPGELEGKIDLEIARLVEPWAADGEIVEVAVDDPAQRRHNHAGLDEDRSLVDGDAQRADQKRGIEGGMAADSDRADELWILDVELPAGDVDPKADFQMERRLQMERRRHREASEARQVEADVFEQIETDDLVAADRRDRQVDDEVAEPAAGGPRHARHAGDRAGIGELSEPDRSADCVGFFSQLSRNRAGRRIPEIRDLAGDKRQRESGRDLVLEPLGPGGEVAKAIRDLGLIGVGSDIPTRRVAEVDGVTVGGRHEQPCAGAKLPGHHPPPQG